MSLHHTCWCTARFELSDDQAGTDFKCTQCGTITHIKATRIIAPEPAKTPTAEFTGTLAPAESVLPVEYEPIPRAFLEPEYLIKQRIFSFQEEYFIQDTAQKTLMVIKRPRYLLIRILSLFVIAFLFLGGMAFSLRLFNVHEINPFLTIPLVFVLALVVGFLIRPKRHISFYLNEAKEKPVLKVFQDSKIMMIRTKFTVSDENNRTIGRIEKNNFSDFLRKTWRCFDAGGNLLFSAVEDSIILSFLRRVLGSFYGLLRIHFVFVSGGSDRVFGELQRQFTLRDRYCLKWNTDAPLPHDRRLLLATAILLDTGERR